MATKKRKYIERTCNPHYNQLQQRNKFNLKKSNFKRWSPSLKTNYARITDDLHFRKSTTKDITMMATPTNIPQKNKNHNNFPRFKSQYTENTLLKRRKWKRKRKECLQIHYNPPSSFWQDFFWQYRPIEIPDKHKLNSCGKVTCLFLIFSISTVKESESFQIRKQNLFTVVNKVFKEPRKMLFEKLETTPSVGLIGDGRYDSSDFNVKYDTDTSCCEKIKLWNYRH